jgi:hypothetical protein
MFRIVIVSSLALSLVFSIFQAANASDPICFNYGNTKDFDRACIVTKIDGNRMCMIDFHVPTKTRGAHEICEFIRDHSKAKVGDQIIVEAVEWKGYPDKCYKSPGCGKVIIIGGH